MTVNFDAPDDGVVRITIDRPDRLNALDAPTIAALHDAFRQVGEGDSNVLILTGAGRGFCTGLDLRDGYPQIPESFEGRLAWMTGVGDLVRCLCDLDQIVVAGIDGPAYGGGFALALGADLRVASDRATFCLPQTRFGLLASEMGVSYLLPRLIGGARAAEILLTGRVVSAQEAVQIGLVTSVVDTPEMTKAVQELAVRLAESPRSALAGTKTLLRAGQDACSLDQALDFEARAQALAFGNPGVRRSIEKYLA